PRGRLASSRPRQPVRPLRPARAVQAPLGPEPGALLLRPAARVPGEGRDLGGDAARGDGAQPRAPRRLRGARADAAAGGVSRTARSAMLQVGDGVKKWAVLLPTAVLPRP